MSAPSKIDRLIEMGLSRYGAGDLEGALLVWEEALAIDPDNQQASSYVDYVRLHVELLGNAPEVASPEDAPFAIEEEPEYQIEVTSGDLPRRAAEPELAPEDLAGGWFEEEIAGSAATRAETVPYEDGEPPALELEAELPPLPEIRFELATRQSRPTSSKSSDFSDVGTEGGTREYRGPRAGEGGPGDFEEYTGGFHAESTHGFSSQETGVRKRDLGFVQPLATDEATADKQTQDLAGTSDQSLTRERRSFARAQADGQEPDEDDLLATLPNPRRPHAVLELPPDPNGLQETQDIPIVPTAKGATKELPDAGRRPAGRDSAELSHAELVLTNAKTQDFQARVDITAPTRDLGIRPRAASSAGMDEEAPTTQSDVRAIRDAAARKDGAAAAVEPDPEGTQSDIGLRFDPIDARAAEILEDVDASAPVDESREDQTRRRIAALLERAVQWNAIGETEKAVSAVDLAMSEDPNSALGQKLITRNRDTILNVFQGYLGDLDRMPQLARPLHELQDAPISPRAAFLLSRIDGTLTLDELLDVSGMPRLEAFRHLGQLYLRGILR